MTVRRGGSDPRSEFEGGGVMPNTVFPKGEDALTNSDRLRLMSLTGQETDSKAAVNPYFWYGNDWPPEPAAPYDEVAALRDPDRYKESPPQ